MAPGRPVAINFEANHFAAEKLEALHAYLGRHGYQCLRWKRTDEMAIRTD